MDTRSARVWTRVRRVLCGVAGRERAPRPCKPEARRTADGKIQTTAKTIEEMTARMEERFDVLATNIAAAMKASAIKAKTIEDLNARTDQRLAAPVRVH